MSDASSAAEAAPRRGPREWTVDTVFFLLAVAYGMAIAKSRLHGGPDSAPDAMFKAEQIAGAVGCGLLWLRRRWPVHLALVLIVLSVFFEMVAGAMLVALFSVAVQRKSRTTALVYLAGLVPVVADVFFRPDPLLSGFQYLVFGMIVQASAVSWGLFVSHRRQLRDRMVAEAELRAEQAQMRTREAVAREMHDVLGHRLSLLSLHAGALEYRTDASPEEVARAAGVIRQSAHQALQDLREVLGVLRAPVDGPPQPTLADVHRLVAESGRAGMRVKLLEEVPEAAPETIGRTAYRVVQEALTNARKHAHGAAVSVQVSGKAGEGLTVAVTNGAPGPRQPRDPAPVPAAPPGQGLAGLAERVALAGGRLEYGPDGSGGWQITACLPWP
ncbi:sensor histidine kinase [Streptomyces abikoensis]|uniref:sensor histidine kinase n=1 Tax=Streptomyces abikoensis TaxID=97398 RepID=UPI0033DE4DC5